MLNPIISQKIRLEKYKTNANYQKNINYAKISK